MNVTPELLRRYSRGECSPAEIQEVEDWLASFHDDATLTDEEIGNSPERIRAKLFSDLFSAEREAGVVPLYKQVIRYAAVACIIIGVFVAGRLSVNTSYAKPAANQEPKDLLYVYGINKSRPQLKGETFRVRFDGQLKLYNGSSSPKRIICGQQQFVLEPRQTYYLKGSDREARLFDNKQLSGPNNSTFSPEGDFSINRIDD